MSEVAAASAGAVDAPPLVRGFREVLLYPLQLEPSPTPFRDEPHWLPLLAPGNVWRDAGEGFDATDPADREQHYTEFVAFMPDVQRFLYGEPAIRGKNAEECAPAIRTFRRSDVATARVTIRPGLAPIDFAVERVELHFFYDIDLAMLAIEFTACDLPLDLAQETLFRLGRAYPASWERDGTGAHCCAAVDLLDAGGAVLASADYANKDRFVASVCERRVSDIAAHWGFLLQPLAPHHLAEPGQIAYHQVEQERIPLLAHLAVEDARTISRDDWVRLGLAAAPGRPGAAPFGARYLDDFETRYCYDRFWDETRGADYTATRMICSGQTFLMVGDAANGHFTDPDRGILAKFRHQYFLLALIAHFHRATLLAFRDRLVGAIAMLRDYAPHTVKRFTREIRLTNENFLRFTHRYWFHEVSNQGPAHDIFERWRAMLDTARLFEEVRQEVDDMMDYLDSESLRRQANTVVRLTVVTFFGLIGTVVTGFLGMNIFDMTRLSGLDKLLVLIVVSIPVTALTFYTAAKSQRLSEFLEAVSNPRLSLWAKLKILRKVWRD